MDFEEYYKNLGQKNQSSSVTTGDDFESFYNSIGTKPKFQDEGRIQGPPDLSGMNNAPQQPEEPSSWNGILDNPISRGAETGLSWAIKPFESVSTGIADTAGAVKNLFGSEKRTGFDGNEYVSTPSEPRSLVSDLKDIWSQTNSNTSSEAWQGAFPNLGKMKGTDKNWTDVLDFGAQSAIPLDVGPLLKAAKLGAKGLSEAKLASNAERIAANELRPSYEDLNLLSRADTNVRQSPTQLPKRNVGAVDNLPQRTNDLSQTATGDAVEQARIERTNYEQKLEDTYGDDWHNKANRKELNEWEKLYKKWTDTQDAFAEGSINRVDSNGSPQYRAAVNPSEAAPTAEVAPTLEAPAMSRTVDPVPLPEAPRSTGVRGNYQNQLNNGNFSDELQSRIRNTDQSYDRVTNRESVATANENVKNLPSAESKFLLNETGGPDHIATGYRLMQELDALGEHSRALVVSKKLAEDLTKGGQTVQAASVISRLSPEGQLLNLVRTADKNGKVVSVADSVKFKELAAKVQEKSGAGVRANEFNNILNRMEKGENVGVEDIKKLSNYLSGAEKVVKPKPEVLPVRDELPPEFKDVRKRDKIVSFLDDAEQAALARIAARKNNLNSLPLPEWRDHAIVVAAQITKGSIKAATHVEDLVKMFGEEIRPVATQVFQSAQNMIKGVSGHAGEGNLERANEALRRVTGQAAAEKEIVQETAAHVRKLIADAKAGKLDPADVQKLRDYSDEIAEMTADKPRRMPTQEEKFLQSVKSLAKKIAQVENEKIPADQANREVSSLLRQITKIGDEGTPPLARQPIDNKALSDIAHDVMEKTRPNPKPTTLQEKIVEKYIKQQEKIGNDVSPRDIDVLRKLAKDVTRLSDNQRFDADLAMQKILNSYEQSSMYDKILTVRYIGMLWNSTTQLINASSGASRAVMGTLEDLPAYMLDRLANAATGSKRNVTLYHNNPLRLLADILKNTPKGMRSGWHGTNPGGITSIDDVRGLVFKNNDTPRPFRGLREFAKKPAQLLERTLGAVAKGADYAVYKSIADNDLIQQAHLSAKNAKIRGDTEIKAHMAKFLESPPPEALMQADNVGKNATFQRMDTAGGKTATSLNRLPLPLRIPVNIAAPFIKTPLNILSAGATYTPYGALKGIAQLISPTAKASNREALRNIGASIIGTGMMTPVGYYLNSIGVITGANDSGDKEVNAIRAQAGQDKYKLNTTALSRYMMAIFEGKGVEGAEKAAQFQKGDTQLDYNKFQPLALSPAIGASINENKGKPIGEAISNIGNDALGSFTSMSMLKGVQGLLAPEYNTPSGEATAKLGSRFAEAAAKTFSPSVLAQEARRQDPIQRKTGYNESFWKDVSDYYKSRTPGLSQTLPSMKTTLGEDKKYTTGIIGQYLNPFKSEEIPYNEAAKIITELIDRTGNMKLAPTAPPKSVEGTKNGVKIKVDLKPERYAQLQEEVGNEIITKVAALDKSLSDAKKMVEIEKIYTKARERAATKAKRELGVPVN